jgi:hypothetical protein
MSLASSKPRRFTSTPKVRVVDVPIEFLSEEETAAEHCQHDNPTIGEEYMFDWLADTLPKEEER